MDRNWNSATSSDSVCRPFSGDTSPTPMAFPFDDARLTINPSLRWSLLSALALLPQPIPCTPFPSLEPTVILKASYSISPTAYSLRTIAFVSNTGGGNIFPIDDLVSVISLSSSTILSLTKPLMIVDIIAGSSTISACPAFWTSTNLQIPPILSHLRPIVAYFSSKLPAMKRVFDGTAPFQSSRDVNGGEQPYRTEAMSCLLSSRL